MRDRVVAIQVSRGVRRWLWAMMVAGLVLGWLTSSVTTYAQKQESINTAAIQHFERFQSTATLLDTKGRTRMVRAAVHQWTILGEQRIPEFQEHGSLLVQLLGGKVSTVIDGKEQRRAKGELWVVPSNAKMSVHTTGETATLEVTIITIS
jgi:quercetin dioxygenase-like cupin family protein